MRSQQTTPWQRPSFSTSCHAKNSSYTGMSRLQTCSHKHLDEDVAGDVGGEHRARRAGGAERALRELAVVAAGEDRAPVLELDDVAGRLLREELDRVLVADVVGALDRVVRVGLGAVFGGVAERRVDAALGGSGVGTSRVDLRDHRDVGARVECLDRGAHPCATGPDNEHVVLRDHED